MQYLGENPAEQTVEFHIPDLLYEDENGLGHTFTITWIHPDFNEQFCHYYTEKPGDLANFYVMKITDDSGDDWLDIETFDDLIAWLEEKQETVKSRTP